jgi:hypothetical protein
MRQPLLGTFAAGSSSWEESGILFQALAWAIDGPVAMMAARKKAAIGKPHGGILVGAVAGDVDQAFAADAFDQLQLAGTKFVQLAHAAITGNQMASAKRKLESTAASRSARKFRPARTISMKSRMVVSVQ